MQSILKQKSQSHDFHAYKEHRDQPFLQQAQQEMKKNEQIQDQLENHQDQEIQFFNVPIRMSEPNDDFQYLKNNQLSIDEIKFQREQNYLNDQSDKIIDPDQKKFQDQINNQKIYFEKNQFDNEIFQTQVQEKTVNISNQDDQLFTSDSRKLEDYDIIQTLYRDMDQNDQKINPKLNIIDQNVNFINKDDQLFEKTLNKKYILIEFNKIYESDIIKQIQKYLYDLKTLKAYFVSNEQSNYFKKIKRVPRQIDTLKNYRDQNKKNSQNQKLQNNLITNQDNIKQKQQEKKQIESKLNSTQKSKIINDKKISNIKQISQISHSSNQLNKIINTQKQENITKINNQKKHLSIANQKQTKIQLPLSQSIQSNRDQKHIQYKNNLKNKDKNKSLQIQALDCKSSDVDNFVYQTPKKENTIPPGHLAINQTSSNKKIQKSKSNYFSPLLKSQRVQSKTAYIEFDSQSNQKFFDQQNQNILIKYPEKNCEEILRKSFRQLGKQSIDFTQSNQPVAIKRKKKGSMEGTIDIQDQQYEIIPTMTNLEIDNKEDIKVSSFINN